MTVRETWLGRLIVWFVALLLRRVRPDERWVEAVSEAYRRGTPVFVLRHLSLIDFLALDHFVRRAGLPRIGFVYGLDQWFFRPFRWIFQAWMHLPRGVTPERHLARLVRRGVPVCLFLRCRPRRFQIRPLRLGPRPLALCLGLARRDVPVVVVPQLLVWGRRPANVRPGVMDRVLGKRESPGLIRSFAQAVKGHRTLVLPPPAAIDLRIWAHGRKDRSVRRLAHVFDAALWRDLETERHTVVGPDVQSHARDAAELFASARFQRELAAIAETRGVRPEQVRLQAARLLREIAARFRIEFIEGLAVIFSRVWSRIYDGIEVDAPSLERVAEAARRGPLVLLPNHRSHIDYIVLSQVFYDARLATPFIAAGRNLAFWPLGPIFRGAGAFFIRRRFEGDDLYVTVLRAYLRRLLMQGCHIELFVEGTRSRTGRLLPPRIGLLGMIAEAGLSLPGRTVHVVPVAITHERVLEEAAHVRESLGGEKEGEDLQGLFGVRRMLASRNGRLYVRFGEPIPLREFAAGEEVAASTAHEDRDRWRRAMRHLAYRSSHAVNRATRVTPNALVAAAFLDRPERAVPVPEIEAEVKRLRDWAHSLGAPLATALGVPGTPDPPREAIRRVLERLAEAKLISLSGHAGQELMSVEDRHRLRLDYYRNSVQHFFLEPALVALGLLDGRGGNPLPARVNRLARLWKNEFVYADEADALPGVERGLAFLVETGAVERDADGKVRTRDAHLLRRFGRILLPCIETYRVLLLVLERTPGMRRRPELIKACLAEAERLHLRGDLACYEARNRFVFENALHGLRDLGLLEIDAGEIRVPPAVRTSDRLVEERNHLAHLAAAVAHRPDPAAVVSTPALR